MLGNAIFRYFSESCGFDAFGTIRSSSTLQFLPSNLHKSIILDVDVNDVDSLKKILESIRPDIVINSVGVVKQLNDVNDPLITIPINSLLPHQLAKTCAQIDARLIHMSTDCIFTGEKGMYTEQDAPDAQDIYGLSKKLGEVDYKNAITLRTSIIGHELNGNRSLIDWFLSQENTVQGFQKAIFSGLPTIEIAKIIKNYVIPNDDMSGVYHVSADPINKYDLLTLVAKIYKKKINIIKNNNFKIDRSLNSSKFREETGYNPPSWNELVQDMHDFG